MSQAQHDNTMLSEPQSQQHYYCTEPPLVYPNIIAEDVLILVNSASCIRSKDYKEYSRFTDPVKPIQLDLLSDETWFRLAEQVNAKTCGRLQPHSPVAHCVLLGIMVLNITGVAFVVAFLKVGNTFVSIPFGVVSGIAALLYCLVLEYILKRKFKQLQGEIMQVIASYRPMVEEQGYYLDMVEQKPTGCTCRLNYLQTLYVRFRPKELPIPEP